MDDDDRLELVRLIASNKNWDTIIMVGRAILDEYYPADIFDGSSGNSGPTYVVAMRQLLADFDKS